MPRNQEHPGQRERAADRRVKALDLRIRGKSYRQIGAELGISHVAAFKHVEQAMAELAALEAKAAEDVRRLELMRIDLGVAGLMPAVEKGCPKAIGALVRLMERRAKLLGLDAPTRVQHGGDADALPIRHDHDFGDLNDEQRLARVHDLLARAGARPAPQADPGGGAGVGRPDPETNADSAGGCGHR